MATGQYPLCKLTAAGVQKEREKDCARRGLELHPQRSSRPKFVPIKERRNRDLSRGGAARPA